MRDQAAGRSVSVSTAPEPEREQYRLDDLLARAPAAIALLTGPEHRWLFINEQGVRLFGRAGAEELIGKALSESVPELESHPIMGLLDEVYRTGEPRDCSEMKIELRPAANGASVDVYFDFSFQPVRDLNGEVEAVLIHAVDVSEKVTARRELEEAEARLRLAQSAGQVGAWEWDPVSRNQKLSQELHRIFGTDASDPDYPRAWALSVFPPDWEMVQQKMAEGYRSGEMDFEYRYRHPRLGLRWLYCKGRRNSGETRMFGIVQDITARKTAHEAAQRLAAIVESSDDAIISKDLNGIVTSWNSSAERIFGYSAAEMIGRPITTIIPPELYSDETRILATIARGERIEHFETVRIRKNDERIDVSLTISPVRDENGRIIGAAKIARDITQQKKRDRALRIAEQLASVGRLAATIAHEINNPLEAVTNLIYLAKSSDDAAEQRKYLGAAEGELERVNHLSRQTLGFYRDTRGLGEMGIGDLVNSLVSVFASRSGARATRFRHEIVGNIESCSVPSDIRQVIANLISNSFDAIEGSGEIRLRILPAVQWKGARRRGVRFTIADNGGGIPASARSKVFEPFFTTKREIGTGLGLWVCKSIVENHGGTIAFRSSTVPGKSGTVFSVFLPLAEPAPAATSAIPSDETVRLVSAYGRGT